MAKKRLKCSLQTTVDNSKKRGMGNLQLTVNRHFNFFFPEAMSSLYKKD